MWLQARVAARHNPKMADWKNVKLFVVQFWENLKEIKPKP